MIPMTDHPPQKSSRSSLIWSVAALVIALGGCGGGTQRPTASAPSATPAPGLVDLPQRPQPVRATDGIATRALNKHPRSKRGPARTPAPTALTAVRTFAETLVELPTEPRAAHRALGALIDRSRGGARQDAEQARAVGLRGRQTPTRVLAVAAGSDHGFYVVAQSGAGAPARSEFYRARAQHQGGGWAVSSWEQIR